MVIVCLHYDLRWRLRSIPLSTFIGHQHHEGRVVGYHVLRLFLGINFVEDSSLDTMIERIFHSFYRSIVPFEGSLQILSLSPFLNCSWTSEQVFCVIFIKDSLLSIKSFNSSIQQQQTWWWRKRVSQSDYSSERIMIKINLLDMMNSWLWLLFMACFLFSSKKIHLSATLSRCTWCDFDLQTKPGMVRQVDQKVD